MKFERFKTKAKEIWNKYRKPISCVFCIATGAAIEFGYNEGNLDGFVNGYSAGYEDAQNKIYEDYY